MVNSKIALPRLTFYRDPSIISFDVSVVGFIMNVKSKMEIGFLTIPIDRNHWIAIRKVDSTFYNFDSKFSKPEAIGNEDDVKGFFRTKLQSGSSEQFIVTTATDANVGD